MLKLFSGKKKSIQAVITEVLSEFLEKGIFSFIVSG